jgi:hypothetical protein
VERIAEKYFEHPAVSIVEPGKSNEGVISE